MSPIEAAYESARDRMPGVSLEQFKTAMKGWRVVPVWIERRMAGAVLVKGPEIHACILPFARGRWMGQWGFDLLNKIIAEHGHVETKVATADGLRFVRRLGFVPDGDKFKRTVKYEH